MNLMHTQFTLYSLYLSSSGDFSDLKFTPCKKYIYTCIIFNFVLFLLHHFLKANIVFFKFKLKRLNEVKISRISAADIFFLSSHIDTEMKTSCCSISSTVSLVLHVLFSLHADCCFDQHKLNPDRLLFFRVTAGNTSLLIPSFTHCHSAAGVQRLRSSEIRLTCIYVPLFI